MHGPSPSTRGGLHYTHRHPEKRQWGEANGAARLMEAGVRAIRARYARGSVGYAHLAGEYGVGKTTIINVVLRRSWPHI